MVAFWTARYNPVEINAHLYNDRSVFFGLNEEYCLSNLCSSFLQSFADIIQVNWEAAYIMSLKELIKVSVKEVTQQINIFIAVVTDLSSLFALPPDFGTVCMPSHIWWHGGSCCHSAAIYASTEEPAQNTRHNWRQCQSKCCVCLLAWLLAIELVLHFLRSLCCTTVPPCVGLMLQHQILNKNSMRRNENVDFLRQTPFEYID